MDHSYHQINQISKEERWSRKWKLKISILSGTFRVDKLIKKASIADPTTATTDVWMFHVDMDDCGSNLNFS